MFVDIDILSSPIIPGGGSGSLVEIAGNFASKKVSIKSTLVVPDNHLYNGWFALLIHCAIAKFVGPYDPTVSYQLMVRWRRFPSDKCLHRDQGNLDLKINRRRPWRRLQELRFRRFLHNLLVWDRQKLVLSSSILQEAARKAVTEALVEIDGIWLKVPLSVGVFRQALEIAGITLWIISRNRDVYCSGLLNSELFISVGTIELGRRAERVRLKAAAILEDWTLGGRYYREQWQQS